MWTIRNWLVHVYYAIVVRVYENSLVISIEPSNEIINYYDIINGLHVLTGDRTSLLYLRFYLLRVSFCLAYNLADLDVYAISCFAETCVAIVPFSKHLADARHESWCIQVSVRTRLTPGKSRDEGDWPFAPTFGVFPSVIRCSSRNTSADYVWCRVPEFAEICRWLCMYITCPCIV